MTAAAAQVIRTAVASAFVKASPATATRIWPDHPRVTLSLAMEEIGKSAAAGQTAPPTTLARATAAAPRAPLLSDPFLIEGASALSEGEAERAETLFSEARRRDPRSAAARYFLAQHYLSTGRPVEGLAEASVLTRLVPGASSAIVPGLARYARDPGAVTNLRRLFETNPELRDQVLAELARDASNAPLVMSLAGNDLGTSNGVVPDWQTQLIRSLIAQGNFAQAHALWLRISGLRGGTTGLFNPQFAKLAAPPPFNWTLGSGNFGVAEASAGGNLQVIYYGRDDARFASQLMLLAPGAYQLRMHVKRDGAREEASGLSWTISCQPAAKQLLALPLTRVESGAGPLTGQFTVPSNCPAQELALSGVAREFAKSEQVLISNLQLVGGVR